MRATGAVPPGLAAGWSGRLTGELERVRGEFLWIGL